MVGPTGISGWAYVPQPPARHLQLPPELLWPERAQARVRVRAIQAHAWISDACHRSYYCGLAMLAIIDITVD